MVEQYLSLPQDSQLAALERTLQILREEDDCNFLIETTLNYLKTEFEYRLIWIGLYDRLSHKLVGKGGTTPKGQTKLFEQQFPLEPGDLLEQVIIQQRPVGIPNLQQEARAGKWYKVAIDWGIQGTLLFPLRHKDWCFGVALLGSHLWGISPRPDESAQLSMLLGQLAAALYRIELKGQYSAAKHADRSLFELLEQLMSIPTVDQRLAVLVSLVQQFVASSRSAIYWYCPQQRYFWHRVGYPQGLGRLGGSKTTGFSLKVAEVNDFYKALAADQLVTIGTSRSLLKPNSTKCILERLRTRSLLAAPIHLQGDLQGFLTVENNQPRIWEEVETHYVRACSHLVSLIVNSEQTEAVLQTTHQDTHLVAKIAQAIARNSDTTSTLNDCAELLCRRLKTNCFFVLQADASKQLTVMFGYSTISRRFLKDSLPPLATDTLQGTQTVAIEDVQADFSLLPWHQALSQLGVRSLLLCQTANLDHEQSPHPPLLLVGDSSPRTWNRTEQDLVSITAQQLHSLLILSHYTETASTSWQCYQMLQRGLSLLASVALNPTALEHTWLKYVADVLDAPLAVLLSWTAEATHATVTTSVVVDPSFALSSDVAIPVATDSLIQATLATPGFCDRPLTTFDSATHQWLGNPHIGQVLAIAVPADTTMAIILLADSKNRQWPELILPPLEILIQQFSKFRDYRHRLASSEHAGETLQALNWYKHRCLDNLYQSITRSLSALHALESKALQPTNSGLQMRRQQLLQQLEATLEAITPILTQEEWQLTPSLTSVPVASLLKRSLRRIESLYREHQLMLKVHNTGKLSVRGDRLKLECIVFELLVTACCYAEPKSWVNLWCRPRVLTIGNVNPSTPLLELWITDNELVNDCLQLLKHEPPQPLHSINLQVCQSLLQSWGGNLQIYHGTTDSYLIQMFVPLAAR